MIQHFRAIVLAALLVAFADASFAAPPPPVPPIADANRVQTYVITSSTPSVEVNFPVFGDCTDIVVYYTAGAGTPVQLALNTDFTCSSVSGGSNLSILPLPITDLLITFSGTPTANLPTVPPATGTLQVVGAWHPRQVVQPTAPGINRREFNQTVSTLIAAQRESYYFQSIADISHSVPFNWPTVSLTGSAKAYGCGDTLEYWIRSNAGTAMADVLPNPVGVVPPCGAIVIENIDATATDTLTVAGGGWIGHPGQTTFALTPYGSLYVTPDTTGNWHFVGTTANYPNLTLYNLAATAAPAATNDQTQGYTIGSRWLDIVHYCEWKALSVTTNAAQWSPLCPRPAGYTASNYYPGFEGSTTNNPFTSTALVYAVRVHLDAGTLTGMGIRIPTTDDSTGGAGIQMGLYAENPATMRPVGSPLAQGNLSVAATGLTTFSASLFTWPGYYWVLYISNSTIVQPMTQVNTSITDQEFWLGRPTAVGATALMGLSMSATYPTLPASLTGTETWTYDVNQYIPIPYFGH